MTNFIENGAPVEPQKRDWQSYWIGNIILDYANWITYAKKQRTKPSVETYVTVVRMCSLQIRNRDTQHFL